MEIVKLFPMLGVVAIVLLLLVVPALGGEDDPGEGAKAYYKRGEEHFFAGRLEEALADWNREIALDPSRGPRHWQRGLVLYYLGKYDGGVTQFLSHQAVNPDDVENAAWHFICTVRGTGGTLKKARRELIPIEGDIRVPMKEIHQLYAGTVKPRQVLARASRDADDLLLRNQLCYAHLYLGLYFEAVGEKERSLQHMEKAALDYRMNHYMGKVAQLHYRLRGGKL